MTPRRYLLPLAGGASLLLAGCADPTPEAALDPATAAVLADASERLAGALDGEDACLALAEAAGLRARATDALAEGSAPNDVVAEILRVADTATADLSCTTDDLDEDDEDDDGKDDKDDKDSKDDKDDKDDKDEKDEKEDGGNGNGNGKGKGKGKGS